MVRWHAIEVGPFSIGLGSITLLAALIGFLIGFALGDNISEDWFENLFGGSRY